MTKYSVKLLTALKSSLERKILLPGATFIGTLSELPKCIAQAVEGKESYINVTEIQEELVDEIDPSESPDVSDSNLPETTPVLAANLTPVEGIGSDEGESTSDDEKDDTEQPPSKLKDKILQAESKLKPKE